MTPSDNSILDFLHNDGEPIRSTPRVIEANINYSISTVRTRVGKLLDRGLIRYYDEKRGIYEITEKGIKSLTE